MHARVGELVAEAQLLGAREGLQARDRRADRESEVERAEAAAVVDEGVDVLLEAQAGVEGAGALHDAEQVVVAPEEHVQPHLDVVPILVLPRRHLAANEWADLEDLDLVTGVGEVHRRDHPGKTGANDTHAQLALRYHARPGLRALHQVLVQERIVAHLTRGAGRQLRRGDHRGCWSATGPAERARPAADRKRRRQWARE